VKLSLLAALVIALLAPAAAAARNGTGPTFVGGNHFERAQVQKALAISRFDFGLVSARVQVQIKRGIPSSYSTPGQVVLDANLLDSADYSWGVVQHEFAHQVDFLLLSDADRAVLLGKLGGGSWYGDETHGGHGQLGAERFASTLAWSYWPAPNANVMQPQGPNDESSALPPLQFRTLLNSLLASKNLGR
jgi:hypothetical protein